MHTPRMKFTKAVSLFVSILACALLLAGLGAGPAGATLIEGGRATLRLSGDFKRNLREHGVSISATPRARLTGSRLEAPIRGGQLMDAGVGVAGIDGGLRFAARHRAVAVEGLSVDTRHGRMRTAFAGKAMTVARMNGGPSEREGFSIRIAPRTLRLTAAFAALLNRSFGVNGEFAGGQKLGTIAIEANLRSVKALDGTIELTFEEGFAAKLEALGARVSPFESAAALGPASFSLPNLTGAVAGDLGGGTVRSPEGIRFVAKPGSGGSEVLFAGISIDLGADLVSAGVRIDLPTIVGTEPLAAADFSGAEIGGASETEIAVAARPARLSAAAARALDLGLLGDAEAGYFSAGEPWAQLAFRVRPG